MYLFIFVFVSANIKKQVILSFLFIIKAMPIDTLYITFLNNTCNIHEWTVVDKQQLAIKLSAKKLECYEEAKWFFKFT